MARRHRYKGRVLPILSSWPTFEVTRTADGFVETLIDTGHVYARRPSLRAAVRRAVRRGRR